MGNRETHKQDYIFIGERIKALRQERKLTVEQLSEMIGTSPSFIGLVERGMSGLSLITLANLSEALNISADYILKGVAYSGKSEKPSKIAKLDELRALQYSLDEETLDYVIGILRYTKRFYRNRKNETTYTAENAGIFDGFDGKEDTIDNPDEIPEKKNL